MIPASVAYARPATVQEASELLADPEAKLLAGGHSLVPMMKLRLARPSLLVDIGRLDMRGVSLDNGVTEVGALTTYDDLCAARRSQLPDALREAAAAVGDVQVRNRGTLGGGIAHADPACDSAASVIALGARLRLRSADGVRECAAEDFFLGPFTTALDPREVLESVTFSRQQEQEGTAYYATEDAASGYPLAGAAVRVTVEGGVVTGATVGLTGATPAPCRLPALEEVLVGTRQGPPLDAVRNAIESVPLRYRDGNERYRRQLLCGAAVRAFESARARAERGERS